MQALVACSVTAMIAACPLAFWRGRCKGAREVCDEL